MVLSKVWRGNTKGTGFVKLNKNEFSTLNEGDRLEINIFEPIKSKYYCSLSKCKHYIGVYIPREICIKNKLLGKKLKFNVVPLIGFQGILGVDGRLYIPNFFADKCKLIKNEIVQIDGKIDGNYISRYCKIKFRVKKMRREFFLYVFSRFKK